MNVLAFTAIGQINEALLGHRRGLGLLSRRSSYVAFIIAPFVVFAALIAFVTAIDPYDVYEWGPQPKLVRDRYSPGTALRLLNVLNKSDYDTFVIGGSTAQQFLPADVEQTLSGTAHAFAVTYNGPLPRDLKMVMSKLVMARNLKRVIVTYDTSWFQSPNAGRSDIPYALYDASLPYLRIVDRQSLELSWRLLWGEEYLVREWDYRGSERGYERQYRRSVEPAARLAAERVIARHKRDVAADPQIACTAFPSLEIMSSFAGQLAMRGARLDVVVPPFSYLAYYEYAEDNRRHIVRDMPPLAAFLASRRCLLEATASLQNVRVYAFDLRQEIVGDLANYRDATHLNGSKVGRQILALINADEDRLTLGNFDAYAAQLRRNVAAFTYTNSALAKQ